MSCKFKAKELLELRRAIARDPKMPVTQIAMIIKLIDDARHIHQGITGCNCWAEAIETANRSVAA